MFEEQCAPYTANGVRVLAQQCREWCIQPVSANADYTCSCLAV